jgi:YVTN family beta-propeller protein
VTEDNADVQNAAGDDSHVIDPHTNQVVGVINDIEIPHGVSGSPDGRYAYIGAVGDNAPYGVDTRSLAVIARVPVGQTPNGWVR